jgi:hypothetical protein
LLFPMFLIDRLFILSSTIHNYYLC